MGADGVRIPYGFKSGPRSCFDDRTAASRTLWLSALQVTVDKRVGNCRDPVNFAHTLAWPLKTFVC
jgi:hypothetical protein